MQQNKFTQEQKLRKNTLRILAKNNYINEADQGAQNVNIIACYLGKASYPSVAACQFCSQKYQHENIRMSTK